MSVLDRFVNALSKNLTIAAIRNDCPLQPNTLCDIVERSMKSAKYHEEKEDIRQERLADMASFINEDWGDR